ncbi:hypothetical protein Bca101_096958 [Brassica carinata]
MEEEDSWQEDQSILDEESSYDHWSEDCSNNDFEEDPYEGDPEPVPPDSYHVDNHSSDCSSREAGPEEGYESGSWQEEAGIESCLENQEEWEHESDEETQLQLDVKKNSWEAQTHPDSYQDIEDSSWAEVPFSGHEERQTLSMKPYRDFGSWYEETDSPISDDEARQSSHEAEIQRDDLGVPKEEEAISEAGRNVKESQLDLAEEKEVESEAERNVTELEPTPTLQLHALRRVRRLITLIAHKRWNRPNKNSQSSKQGIHSRIHYNFQKGQKYVQGQKEIQNIQKERPQ